MGDGLKEPNPWHPITDTVDLKHLGKLAEEAGELCSAASRCMIQGMNEAHPTTGKINREWLEDEIADVFANIDLCMERFDLDQVRVTERMRNKFIQLRKWHDMA
jgi:hypothetical protein